MIFKPNIYEIENDLYNLSIESEKEMGIFHISHFDFVQPFIFAENYCIMMIGVVIKLRRKFELHGTET